MLDTGFLGDLWSVAGIMWGYASFAPAILAFIAALGIVPSLPRLPWLVASAIIAASCTYGGYGVGFGKGELAERAVWELAVATERAAREKDRLEAEVALANQARDAAQRAIKMAAEFRREQDDLLATITELTQQGNQENEDSQVQPALPIYQTPIIIDGQAACPPCEATRAPSPAACVGTRVPPSILQRIK